MSDFPSPHKIAWLQQQGLFPPADKTPGVELMTAMNNRRVEAWNRLYPVGTPVKCYRCYGDEKSAFLSRTRSEAYMMGGHSGMVLVDGHSGGYALTHVQPLVGAAEVTGQINLNSLDAAVVMVLGDLTGVHGEGVAGV